MNRDSSIVADRSEGNQGQKTMIRFKEINKQRTIFYEWFELIIEEIKKKITIKRFGLKI